MAIKFKDIPKGVKLIKGTFGGIYFFDKMGNKKYVEKSKDVEKLFVSQNKSPVTKTVNVKEKEMPEENVNENVETDEDAIEEPKEEKDSSELKTNVEKIRAEMDRLMDQYSGFSQKMDSIDRWNSLGKVLNNLESISLFAIDVILLVELAVNSIVSDLEDLKSDDKLEAAATMLDDAVDFKGLSKILEAVDKSIFKIIITGMVRVLNDSYGHDWGLGNIRNYLKSINSMTDSFVAFIKKITG